MGTFSGIYSNMDRLPGQAWKAGEDTRDAACKACGQEFDAPMQDFKGAPANQLISDHKGNPGA